MFIIVSFNHVFQLPFFIIIFLVPGDEVKSFWL